MGTAGWDSVQMGNCELNHQQFLSVIWGLNQGLGFPIKWGTVESQLGGEPSYCQLVQRVELGTKRNLPMAHGEEGELEGFKGTMPVFLVIPKVIRSFLRIPQLSPNMMKNRSQLSKF